MRNCYCLDHNLKQKCETDIGGIDRIYLINAQDYIGWEFDKLILKTGTYAYLIDFADQMGNFQQETVNNYDQSYIQHTLTFTMRFETANLEDELKCLQLGQFKLLIRYKNRYWRFVDEDPLFNFKQESIVHNSGTTDDDMNEYTFVYTLHSHNWRLLFEDPPDFETSDDTTPQWTLINEECEETE